MSGVGEEKPLRKIAAAFDPLAHVANSGGAAMELAPFSRACAHVSVLFGCLGIAFKFAEKDYVSKVDDLIEASKSISTLKNMIELDIQHDCVRQGGSHTRNLLRVLRGLDMVRVLFEEIIKSEFVTYQINAIKPYCSTLSPKTLPILPRLASNKNRSNTLREAASVSYAKVFAPHHGWAIRKAVGAGMYALPSKSQLLKRLNEDESSAKVEMQSFIRSSGPVIQYIEELFNSRQLGVDW